MGLIIKAFKNTFVFSGRLSRAEYRHLVFWLIALSIIMDIFLFLTIEKPGTANLISTILFILIALPLISASIRRLHDTGKSGWLFLLNLIPFFGNMWFLLLAIRDGEPGANRYGENPIKPPLGPPATGEV